MKTQAAASAFRIYQLYVVAVVVFLVGNLSIRQLVEAEVLPHWARVALALATVVPFLATAFLFRRLLTREMDELIQRVVLEGLAFAFVFVMPVVAIVVNLHSAGVYIPRLDPPELILFPLLMVGLGVTLAWRRYQ